MDEETWLLANAGKTKSCRHKETGANEWEQQGTTIFHSRLRAGRCREWERFWVCHACVWVGGGQPSEIWYWRSIMLEWKNERQWGHKGTKLNWQRLESREEVSLKVGAGCRQGSTADEFLEEDWCTSQQRRGAYGIFVTCILHTWCSQNTFSPIKTLISKQVSHLALKMGLLNQWNNT